MCSTLARTDDFSCALRLSWLCALRGGRCNDYGVHSTEIRKGSAVYDLSHRCFVRQIIQVLQQIDPQHTFQIARLIAVRPDECEPPSLRYNAFYLRQKSFFLSVLAPSQPDLLAYSCRYSTTFAFVLHLFCAALPKINIYLSNNITRNNSFYKRKLGRYSNNIRYRQSSLGRDSYL